MTGDVDFVLVLPCGGGGELSLAVWSKSHTAAVAAVAVFAAAVADCGGNLWQQVASADCGGKLRRQIAEANCSGGGLGIVVAFSGGCLGRMFAAALVFGRRPDCFVCRDF